MKTPFDLNKLLTSPQHADGIEKSFPQSDEKSKAAEMNENVTIKRNVIIIEGKTHFKLTTSCLVQIKCMYDFVYLAQISSMLSSEAIMRSMDLVEVETRKFLWSS